MTLHDEFLSLMLEALEHLPIEKRVRGMRLLANYAPASDLEKAFKKAARDLDAAAHSARQLRFQLRIGSLTQSKGRKGRKHDGGGR